jgi:hypothetical protein
LLVSKRNKASKLFFQRKFALLIDFFFLLPPKFWVLGGFFFPLRLLREILLCFCVFLLFWFGVC